MTPIKEAFEALLPQPDIRVDAFGNVSASDRRPFIRGNFYTRDQMRQMFDAATDRAAKLCEEQAGSAAFVRNYSATFGAEQCAAAIRGDGGGT